MSPHDHDLQAAADEARLTAYALGEVSGDEAATIAARIAVDPDARRTVEEVRAVAALLSEGIGAGEPAGLADAQRAVVLAEAEKVARRPRLRLWPAAVAAASIVGLGLLAQWAESPRYGLDMASGASLEYGWGPSTNAQFGAEEPGVELPSSVQFAGDGGRTVRIAAATTDYSTVAIQKGGTLRVRADRERVAGGGGGHPVAGGDGAGYSGDQEGAGVYAHGSGAGGGGARGPGSGGAHVPGGGAEGVPILGDRPVIGGRVTTGYSTAGGAIVRTRVAEPLVDFTKTEDLFDAAVSTAEWEQTVPGTASAIMTIAGGSAADGAFKPSSDITLNFMGFLRHSATYDTNEVAGLSAEQAEAIRGYLDRSVDRDATIREIARRLQYPGGEAYEHPGEARFRNPRQEPLSTFSIDVDTASYANVRRFLNDGALPPAEAVRLEEMINYFDYDYTPPEGEHPVAATIETASCPWNTSNRLVRIGLRARDIVGEAPPANLVFLVDVSGSMQPSNKLPLVQQSLRMLVDQMREQDRIAIVTYANGSGVRLASTTGDAKDAIRGVIDGLTAGGSTNGGAGIQDAYRIAAENLFQGGTNRVVLATDGDFNVGVTDRNDLVTLIEEQAKTGVFLSVLGVGTGNIKDATLEQLADKGNGNYSYLDSLQEARKVLVDEMMGTLVAVAKDVKVQVEFNPLEVQSYRMIGYENRVLATQDFDDDTKDAGEMGAGHTVTMLYEIVPAPGAAAAPLPRNVEELRYQRPPMEATEAARTGEIMTLKFRYKQPDANESVKLEVPVKDSGAAFDAASADFRFASAVASFGMLLRRSPTAQGISWDGVLELASGSLGEDPKGRRAEMLDLVRRAKELSGR